MTLVTSKFGEPTSRALRLLPSSPIGVALVFLAVACLGRAGAVGTGPGAERLRVEARVRPALCFVGQAVELRVDVVAGRERPQMVTPRVDGADVTLAGTETLEEPVGDAGSEPRTRHRWLYQVVPRRPGIVTIPPAQARLDARNGAGPTTRLNVEALPPEGRNADFLGGVGPFEVDASVRPDSVRTGQPLEYRVRVSGPAARGTREPPRLDRLRRVAIGLRAERLPDEDVADPPSHTFVFRLRPTGAGAVTLPPVAIAAFDPEARRYVTKVTAGLPVRVTDVARFDPATLDYGPPPRDTLTGAMTRTTALAVLVLAGLALVASGLTVRLARRRVDPTRAVRRLGERLATQLKRADGDAERGRLITEALADYLRVTADRPSGALTPAEAEGGVTLSTGRADLARDAADLVAGCDAARFGGGARSDVLSDAATDLFRKLAAAAPGRVPGKHDERQSTP